MATTVMILGESGTGKSTSIRNLPKNETAIINVLGKPLPFRSGKSFQSVTMDQAEKIISALQVISKSKHHIKYVVVDDFQYLMANEFMNRSSEKGYDKFTDIAVHAWSVIRQAQQSRDDMIVFFLAHTDTDINGKVKCKTIGKMLDEKICIEGMFTIVLNTIVKDGKYIFQTQNNGYNTTKSPMEMFIESEIDNDLSIVVNAIKTYYQED